MKLNNNCLICFKPIKANFILANKRICKSCYKKFKYIYNSISLEKIDTFIVYEYNDFSKEILVKIKGYYDIELAKVFLEPIKEFLKIKYKDYIILPAPSSQSSNKKRGFNHVIEIFKPLALPIINCFTKANNYKQSDSHKYSRINILNNIFLDTSKLNKNKKYLIVDDVTTTHFTLITLIRLLKKNGINNIKCLAVLGKK